MCATLTCFWTASVDARLCLLFLNVSLLFQFLFICEVPNSVLQYIHHLCIYICTLSTSILQDPSSYKFVVKIIMLHLKDNHRPTENSCRTGHPTNLIDGVSIANFYHSKLVPVYSHIKLALIISEFVGWPVLLVEVSQTLGTKVCWNLSFSFFIDRSILGLFDNLICTLSRRKTYGQDRRGNHSNHSQSISKTTTATTTSIAAVTNR